MLDAEDFMADLKFVLEHIEISQNTSNLIYMSMWNLISSRLG